MPDPLASEQGSTEWEEAPSPVQRAVELCRIYARARRPILLLGPVGAGKTTLARAIHDLSGSKGKFVAVSAGELSETLHQDTLFGHVAGAYTGATGARLGAFGQAADGTLLLDDLALMTLVVQASILRVLENRTFLPLGSLREVPATGREIFASTVEPAQLLAAGRILPDLESRLGELVIRVPSLMDRANEIPNLADQLAKAYLLELGRTAEVEFDPLALQILRRHVWPKNLRELRNVIERSILHADPHGDHGRILVLPHHLPERLSYMDRHATVAHGEQKLSSHVVESAVRDADGNRSEAARRLGVHRNTITKYLRRT